MEQLLITVEDVKNELDLNLSAELGMQPKQTDAWLLRVQRTVVNYIADFAGGLAQAEQLLENAQNKKVAQQAMIEQIYYLSNNNYVQANGVMNIGEQTVQPVIAPLARQLLSNAGLLSKKE
ncbi:MAG: hypothetical protein NC132_05520 [Corallococcus sp.]|nr:hypothetical protein [Corallococcus sp.]MCM1359995.1 hypothetical protein [Corallococcus sp.]MCM1395552.1 hypothetical protein [Corallococcus sp.]